MELTIRLDSQTERELLYAVTELDIVTCQEGQCLDEPAHWTPEDVALIILRLYINDIRTLVTIKPVPMKIWEIILPRTGRAEPPTYQPTIQNVANAGGRSRKRKQVAF